MSRMPTRHPAAILAVPVTTALLVMTGLVSGLTGSGWRDAFCTGALSVPLILFLFHFLRRAMPGRSSSQKARP